ncbi:MAG: hypothetical protein M3N16_01710 [Actinomycetota bacterium]|nr:hypothetical protein [Actinomycetota bacterium]
MTGRTPRAAEARQDARNRAGQTYALTVLTPILPGRHEALRECIEGFGIGPESPLAKLESTHFARLVVIPQLIHEGGWQRLDELRNQYLLFATDFDGTLERYLDDVCERMGEEADRIWGHCVGYPGTADRAAFERYIRHNQLVTKFPFAPYGDKTVAEVREALALRQRLIDFAIRTQGMAPEELYEAYRQEFGPPVAERAPEMQLR